ncbi:MAG: AAA family ATPase [Planctomycetota bacterium]
MILGDLNLVAFRGMTNVHLRDLAPVNLVVGANNVGKSSVLEAAALLLRPLDPAQWVQVARHRDFDMSLVDGLWSLFPSGAPLQVDDGPKQTAPFRVAGVVHDTHRDLSASGLASQTWDAEESGDLTLRVDAKVDNKPRHTMEFRREVPAQFGKDVPFYRCFTVTPATHRSTRILVEHLSKAVDEGDKPLALELLRLFDHDVSGLDVSATRGRDGIRITHTTRGVVDLASFGDGMRRAAALALALVRSRGGLLLVDELEAAIHPTILPEVLTRLFAAAATADVQILATTHSLEAIDALTEALRDTPDRAAAYYLQRDSQGHTVRRYDQDGIVSLREVGLDLR